jgi:hypothetical protein
MYKAILQLNQPAELNQYVQIACLPNKLYGSVFPSTAKSNVTAFAMGWVYFSYIVNKEL